MTSSAVLPPIFAFSRNAWSGTWMNRQQLLSRLARRGWPVVYSTGALSLWDRDTPDWQQAGWLAKMHPSEGVWIDEAGRWPLLWPKVPFLGRWAAESYARGLTHRAAAQLGLPDASSRSIAYLFRPRFVDLLPIIRPRYVVYHAYDNYSLGPDWTPELAASERALVARADLIIGTSEQILESLPRGGSAPRRVLQNGADASVFAAGHDEACPPDLAAIPHPRIAYVGRINRKVDFALVGAIAKLRPKWHWVFVGPVLGGRGSPDADPANSPWFNICKTLPNVHFLGAKERAELPAYMAHVDVNTMCYRESGGWWTAGHPLKLHEYLAVGLPVVSASLDTIRGEAGVIDIVSGTDGWIAAIERALAGRGAGTPEQRRAIAFQNSWRHRVDQLEIWLREMMQTN